MKIKNESLSLIIVGNWNRNIFTPEWVSKNIYDTDQVQVEFPFNVIGPMRFEHQKIRLIPASNRLLFVALDDSVETLERMESMASKIGGLLPHTPVTAFGMNFGFSETIGNNISLLSIFSISDNEKLGEFGAEIKTCQIARKIIIDGNTLNFSISKDTVDFVFDFNFHFDIKQLSDISTILTGKKINQFKDLASSILKNAYDLEFQREGA